MTLHWFKVPNFPSPADALEAVSPFGVTLLSPFAESAHFYWDGDANGVLVNAGVVRVYEDGRITVQPYANLPAKYVTALIGCGEDAFKCRPRTQNGWTRLRRSKNRPEPYWWSRVAVRADDDEISNLVRAARRIAMRYGEVRELTAQQVRESPQGNPSML